MESKKCIKCKEIKLIRDFERKKSCRDGHINVCRACILARRHELHPLRGYVTHRISDGVAQKLCNVCKKWKSEKHFHKNRARPDGLHSECKECLSPRPEGMYVPRSEIVMFDENGNAVKKKCKDCGTWKDTLEYRAGMGVCRICYRAKRRIQKKELAIQRGVVTKRTKRYILDNQGHLAQIVCKRCGLTKEPSQFIKTKSARYGISPVCLGCSRRKIRVGVWRKVNPEKYLGGKRKWRIANPQKNREYSRRHLARKQSVLCTLNGEQWIWLLEVTGKRCLASNEYCSGVISQDHVVPRNPGTHTLDNVQPLCLYHNESKGRKTIDYRPDWLKELIRDKMIELGLELTYL